MTTVCAFPLKTHSRSLTPMLQTEGGHSERLRVCPCSHSEEELVCTWHSTLSFSEMTWWTVPLPIACLKFNPPSVLRRVFLTHTPLLCLSIAFHRKPKLFHLALKAPRGRASPTCLLHLIWCDSTPELLPPCLRTPSLRGSSNSCLPHCSLDRAGLSASFLC